MANRQPSGAAQRRRQRRLRSWWRHEQQSIAMALVAAAHHSAQYGAPRSQRTATRAREEAWSETYHAPRGPKTLPPWMRPTPPSEVAGPQVVAATVGQVAAWAPLLAVSSLRGADGVNDTTVKFLLRAELKEQKEEEVEEERKQELVDEALDDKLDAEMDALMAIGPERLTSRHNARFSRAELIERSKRRRTMRKKNQRRKKKLPRSGSTRRRQWHDRCAGFFLVVMHLEMCSLWSTTGPRCSASWPVWTRRTV